MKGIALLALLAAAGTARATTFDMVAYSTDAPDIVALNNGINSTVTVTTNGTSLNFRLQNQSTSGRVTAFYIELGSFLGGVSNINPVMSDVVGSTNFIGSNDPTPNGTINPPAPNNIGGWQGNFYAIDVVSQGGQTANSLQVGETMDLTFTISDPGQFNFNDLIDAIANGDIRLAQRYQSFGTADYSAWLTNTTVIIPLPPAGWAGLGTLGLVAGVRAARRRRLIGSGGPLS